MSSRANNDTTTALDALASLASSHFSGAVTATNTATATGLTPASPDSKSMPPPPRRIRRIRSSSNPEGMEKWDSYNYPKEKGLKRLHFVLPSTILEEELANANDMCIEHEKEQQRRLEEMGKMGPRHRQKHLTKSIPVRKIGRTDFSIQCQPEVDGLGLYGTSPDTVIPSLSLENDNGKESAEVGVDGRKAKNKKGGKRKKKVVIVLPQDDQDSDDNVDAELEVEEDVNESDLEPEELLRRARSRLFEDSSAENGMEKGAAMAFPHSLCKYKEVRVVRVLVCFDISNPFLACVFLTLYFPSICLSLYRFTIRTVVLEFTHLRKGLQSLRNSIVRELEGLGRKRFVIIVEKILPIAV